MTELQRRLTHCPKSASNPSQAPDFRLKSFGSIRNRLRQVASVNHNVVVVITSGQLDPPIISQRIGLPSRLAPLFLCQRHIGSLLFCAVLCCLCTF